MAAPKGNQYWRLRSKHGRDKLFTSPELLWEAACEYFQWCESHPLEEEKVWQYQGDVVRAKVSRMRAMTMNQLCFYLGASESYFRYFKSTLKEEDKDFLTVINEIEDIIYNQKFQGAAADLLNANIIARDLGLRDNQSVDHTSNGEKMDIKIAVLDEETARVFKELRDGSKAD
jgi:hypothetical protein